MTYKCRSSCVQIRVDSSIDPFHCLLLILLRLMHSEPNHRSYETSQKEDENSHRRLSVPGVEQPGSDEGSPTGLLGGTFFDGGIVESQSGSERSGGGGRERKRRGSGA